MNGALIIHPDETRVIVDGQEVPPYIGALAYVRDTTGVYYIRYADGHSSRLGMAHVAFGDDADIELHPSEY